MNRPLIALILIIALGMQGSLAAYALGPAPSGAECPMQYSTMDGAILSQHCCEQHSHGSLCCDAACVSAVAGPAPHYVSFFAPVSSTPKSLAKPFLSRNDAPLVRPPIQLV